MQGLKSKLIFTLLGITETCSFIQRLNSYILLIDKVTEKVTWTIYRLDKNAKKYQRVGNELSIKDNIKPFKYKSCFSFRACQKTFLNLLTQLIQFTD